MATVPLVYGDVAEHQIHDGKPCLILGPETGKNWWLKKGATSPEKYHCQWTILRGKKPMWIFHNIGNLVRPLEPVPASRERVVPTEWRTFLEDCISRAKVIPGQAVEYRQYALISDFLDLANLSIKEEAAQATNWIKYEPEGLKLTEPCVGHQDGPIYRQFTGKILLYAINQCESWGPGHN